MKKKIVCLMTAAILMVSQLPILQKTASAKLTEVQEENYASVQQEFTPLDFSHVAFRDFADDVEGDGVGGWTDQGSVNDMRFFTERGLVKMKGVEFNILDPATNGGKAVTVLRGQNDENCPQSVDIPVNAKGAGVYFLHAGAWMSSGVLGTYTMVYEDGTKHSVDIINGKNLYNFWGTGSSDTTITAWTGSNNQTSAASLYLYAMENPYPDKKIEKLTLSTVGKKAYICVVAATLTDSGPYLWRDADKSNVDTSNWWAYTVPSINSIQDTVLDMSFAHDAPAGKHGWLKPEGEKLYFEDGTPVQFWGVNLTADSQFMPNERAKIMAERLAAQGFNLVRFHHNDSIQYHIYEGKTPNGEISAEQLDRMHFLMNELKKNGIYVFIDGSQNYKRVDETLSSSNPYNTLNTSPFFSDQAANNGRRYLRQVFNSYNPYTGMKVAEDPMLVFIDLTNENRPFDTSPLASGERVYTEFKQMFSAWLEEKYGSDEAIANAWRFEGEEGVLPGESLAKGNYDTATSRSTRRAFTRPRLEDANHFIADRMRKFYLDCEEDLRSYGYKNLIVSGTTSFGSTNAQTLVDAMGGFTDSHQYHGHPANNNGLRTGTTIGGFPVSQLSEKNGSFMNVYSYEGVYGKPHTQTEWEACQQNPHLYEGSPIMSAYAALHEWHPMYFGAGMNQSQFIDYDYGEEYTATPIKDADGNVIDVEYETAGHSQLFVRDGDYGDDFNRLSNFFMYYKQPIQMAQLPVAGLSILRGDIQHTDKGFFDRIRSAENYRYTTRKTDPLLSYIGKTGVVFDSINYDESVNSNEVLYRGVMSEKLGLPLVSMTGEIRMDRENETLEINTANTQQIVGEIGGRHMESDDMRVNIENEQCAIALTSLSMTEPIWNADKCLLTVAGDARNTGEVRSTDGLKIERGGWGPVLVEPIVGEITLKSKDTFEVYRIASSGNRMGTAMTYKDKDGNTVIRLTDEDHCLNYEIVRTKKADGTRQANEHIVYEAPEYKSLFTDMEMSHWAYKAVERNILEGIMTSPSSDEFQPDTAMSRADFVGALMTAVFKTNIAVKDVFGDVDNSTPYKTAIQQAAGAGIVTPDENGNFRPYDPITREEAMAVVYRALEFELITKEDTDENVFSKYTDSAKVSGGLETAVKSMLSQRYFNEMWQGEIQPQKAVSRAEAAYIIYGARWY